MKLTCIFIEDETPALNLLKIYGAQTPTLDVLGYFDNVIDALQFLSTNNVDIIFTDVSMPKMSGIELVQSLRNKPYIVFITSNSEHAVSGFDLDITDFLVKPVRFERFLKAVNKILDSEEQKRGLTTNNSNKENLAQEDDASYSLTSIYVKESGKVIRVDMDEIMAIEGLKDYVKILTHEKPIVTHLTMKKLEEQILPKHKFMRVHKSYIIGLNHIRKFDGVDSLLELKNKLQIPVGPQYKETLILKLKPVN